MRNHPVPLTYRSGWHGRRSFTSLTHGDKDYAQGSATFQEFAEKAFWSYIFHQLRATKRLDVVWDIYIADIMKQHTRERREKGIRRKVEKNTRIPSKWQVFLQDSDNKIGLIKFLTDAIANAEIPPVKALVVTAGVGTIAKGMIEAIPPCHQEEADTIMMFHFLDALKVGSATCIVQTVDTDVICILIGKFHSLQERCLQLCI